MLLYVNGHPLFLFHHFVFKHTKLLEIVKTVHVLYGVDETWRPAYRHRCFHFLFCPIKPQSRFKLDGALVGVTQDHQSPCINKVQVRQPSKVQQN